jgi:hypothetical protein
MTVYFLLEFLSVYTRYMVQGAELLAQRFRDLSHSQVRYRLWSLPLFHKKTTSRTVISQIILKVTNLIENRITI